MAAASAGWNHSSIWRHDLRSSSDDLWQIAIPHTILCKALNSMGVLICCIIPFMKTGTLSSEDYRRILDYAVGKSIKLIICDFNGVLDDYYIQKYNYIESVLGEDHSAYMAELAVYTDIVYMSERATSIEDVIIRFYEMKGWKLDSRGLYALEKGVGKWHMTKEAEQFIRDSVGKTNLVIYTSQTSTSIKEAMPRDLPLAGIYSRDLTRQEKPSVTTLEMICRENRVQPHEVCVVGDGLIDDLMPAKLLGAYTILVTPFADTLLSIK